MSIVQPKVLCLFSSPLVDPKDRPLDALNVEAERDAVIASLESCNRQVLLRIRTATVNELAAGVTEGFNILHLSCHGHETSLLFEDGKGGSHPIPGEYLKKLIGVRKSFDLAIVSACYSEQIAHMMAEAGIQHVISIRRDTPVLDHAATVFVRQFYQNLFHGDTVQQAFEMAKLLVEGNPELTKIKPHLESRAKEKGEPFVAEEDKFILLPSDDPVHLKPLISEEISEGTVSLEAPKLSKTNLPVRPQSFTGRSMEMHRVINLLLANRVVTLTGAGGIGKTTLAREVARWFNLREQFPDGVFSIDLREVDSAEGIIALIGTTLDAPLSEPDDIVKYLLKFNCLLLLDNAEDVLRKDEDAVQDLISRILQFAPRVKFLITSQRTIGGILHEPEHTYRLRPLEELYAKRPQTISSCT